MGPGSDSDDATLGGRNKDTPDGNKKAKEKIKRESETSRLRDTIDHMVKSNETMVAKTLEAKKGLADKKAQEKREVVTTQGREVAQGRH